MATTSITISDLKDPVLRALARSWNKNGDDTLEVSELPERDHQSALAIFDRMTANAPPAAALGSPTLPPTAAVNALAPAPAVAFDVFNAGLRGYQRGLAVPTPGGAPTIVGSVQVVRALATSDAQYDCATAGSLAGGGLGYAFAYGVPVGVMLGTAAGSFLDTTGTCPTGKINRIAGDVAYLSSFVPAEQVASYVSVVWNGAMYYLGYAGVS